MHLPFTYATGEALLYQSAHPIPGFGETSHDKNGMKSKKSRTERLLRDGLDPGSLLGALMSQDESVYVCQPALEPKMSFHNSFFEQMGFSNPEQSSLHNSWDEPNSAVLGSNITEPNISFDPLLATLDSLSLESQGVVDAQDGSCSNGELFGALEGLGLTAEDLELLLLDERMIRVEMDLERVPTLDDLLTNDEILSYIYDSLEGKAESAENGGHVPNSTAPVTVTTTSLPESIPNNNSNIQMQQPHHRPPLVGQSPILQLSQQMQQHLNMRTSKMVQDWGQQSDHLTNTIAHRELQGQGQPIANGQWSTQDIPATVDIGLKHCNTQQTLFNGKDSKLEHQQLRHRPYFQHQQQPRMQNQLPQQDHVTHNAAHLNGVCGISSAEHSAGRSQWQDYGFNESLCSNSCLDNSQKPIISTSVSSCRDYSVPGIQNTEYSLNGSSMFGRNRQHHVAECAVPSYQGMTHQRLQDQFSVPIAQVISELSQCPPPNTSLEQILGVGKSCQQLDHYGMVTMEIPDPNHSKVSL